MSRDGAVSRDRAMGAHTPDTIVAVATPPGEGAIAIVRLSGPEALSIAESVFSGSRRLSEVRSHSLVHGRIVDQDNRMLDDVLVGVMRAPRTFTGEDIVEINCHGGPLVVKSILTLLLSRGARAAERGEFSLRAFLNGRMDLAQAEAVIDLVRSRSPVGMEAAAKQLEGALSRRIEHVRDRLLHLLAHMQVLIDYPEEGAGTLTDEEALEMMDECLEEIGALLESAEAGRIYREGMRLAIVGRPNVGKSSLLNALLGEDRAIVTDIAGTTRDTIDAPALLDGVPVTLVDTAGLRDARDPVEEVGIRRSREVMGTADLVLIVVDGASPLTAEDRGVFEAYREHAAATPALVAVNKADLPQRLSAEELEAEIRRAAPGGLPLVRVSAKTGEGLEALGKAAVAAVVGDGFRPERHAVLVTRARHKAALERARASLSAARESLEMGMTWDVISVELQESLESLGEVTGVNVAEDVVARIFSEFCVGK